MGRTVEERNALIESVLFVVRREAFRAIRRITNETLLTLVTKDDLFMEGVLALIPLADRYDENRDLSFRAYATPRIIGAIKDYLRTLDYLPRRQRDCEIQIERAWEALSQEWGREPTRDEAIRTLRLGTVREQHARLRPITEVESLEVEPAQSGFEPVAALRVTLEEAILQLPEDQRVMLILNDLLDLPKWQIARVLKVPERALPYLLTQAHRKLKILIGESNFQ